MWFKLSFLHNVKFSDRVFHEWNETWVKTKHQKHKNTLANIEKVVHVNKDLKYVNEKEAKKYKNDLVDPCEGIIAIHPHHGPDGNNNTLHAKKM